MSPDHPRLWVRNADLPRLQSWARSDNPLYADTLEPLARRACELMDSGRLPQDGECAIDGTYCESFAELLAFMALIAPTQSSREDYAARAHALLMHLMNRANANDSPLRTPSFSTSDRSRWAGEAFALTTDWVYSTLSPSDKSTIRDVFLRWAEQQLHAEVTEFNHPQPIGVLRDEILVQDRIQRRFGLNNYFTSHMRNLGLMAMALDPSDDPSDATATRTYPNLRSYLANATDAWLFVVDRALHTDAKGGVSPEGMQYGPQTLAYIAQFLLALQSAAPESTSPSSPTNHLLTDPFWDDVILAHATSLSPAPVTHHDWRGPESQPAFFGDGEVYQSNDPIDLFAPLGLIADRLGNNARLQTLRWLQAFTPVGGIDGLLRRAGHNNSSASPKHAIAYFLLFDPAQAPRSIPPPSLPLEHFAPGVGWLSSRTAWSPNATWFTFQLGWSLIDHQHGDGNTFGFYRAGEWLTKERVGYGYVFENSDQHNTLCLQNDRPRHADDPRRESFWSRGSQWVYGHNDDGKILAHSSGPGHVYALGDSTGLYNSDHEKIHGVLNARRAIIWLKPDHIVLFDQAQTVRQEQFKRFWLQTPSPGQVEANRVTVHTPGGQHLYITTVLPEAPSIQTASYPPSASSEAKPADYEPMTSFVCVEPKTRSRDAVFLHVLQGADATTPPSAVQRLAASSNALALAVSNIAVVFSTDSPGAPGLWYRVPLAVSQHWVTGLVPGTSYSIRRTSNHDGTLVEVGPGSALQADAGGVLTF